MTNGLGTITNTDHQTPFDAGIVDEFGNVIADDDQPPRPILEGKENRGGINVNPADQLLRPAPQ
jgi:hypothetical protein